MKLIEKLTTLTLPSLYDKGTGGKLGIKIKRDNLEYDFLPDALEIAEKPPSPLPGIIVFLLFTIIITSILWACLGELDVVAVSRGKVIPDGRLKVIQPLEEGIVTAIYVEEGQKVKEGETLIELDSTMKRVNEDTLRKSLEIAKLEKSLLDKLFHGEDISNFITDDNLSEEFKSTLLKLSESKNENYSIQNEITNLAIQASKKDLEIADNEIDKLKKNMEALNEQLRKYKEFYAQPGVQETVLSKVEHNIKILREDEETLRKLYEKKAISKKEWEDKNNQLILEMKEYQVQKAAAKSEKDSLELQIKNIENNIAMQEKELISQNQRIEQARIKLKESYAQSNEVDKQKDLEILDMLVQKDKQISETEAELTKNQKSMEFQTLKSPVDGVINGLNSNTIGGVVTPAQPIVTIVPDGTPLIIEATVLNKDIGFIKKGQDVTVKVDTFPFQKYGTLNGKVINISADVFEDEKLGAVYKMKVKLEQEVNKQIRISPGMATTAEIKTGKRRIIEFFLDPLVKYAEESLKLR